MKYVILAIGYFYGGITALTGGMMLTQRQWGILPSGLMFLGGLGVVLSFAGLGMDFVTRETMLIAGLLMIHISSIMNGFKVNGKPMIKHHLVRLLISCVIVAGSISLFKL